MTSFIHKRTKGTRVNKLAILSGFLGASASFIGKLALSPDSPVPTAVHSLCLECLETFEAVEAVETLQVISSPSSRSFPLSSISSDIVSFLDAVNEFMQSLSSSLNFVPNISPSVASAVSSFSSSLSFMLPPLPPPLCPTLAVLTRLLSLLAMIGLNAFMMSTFLDGMNESGSVVGTALSTAANFGCSAMYGILFFREHVPPSWYLGATLIALGMWLLSSVALVNAGGEGKKKIETK